MGLLNLLKMAYLLLQMILCGMQNIDVDDWQQNTNYKDYTASSKQIVWFWKVS